MALGGGWPAAGGWRRPGWRAALQDRLSPTSDAFIVALLLTLAYAFMPAGEWWRVLRPLALTLAYAFMPAGEWWRALRPLALTPARARVHAGG